MLNETSREASECYYYLDLICSKSLRRQWLTHAREFNLNTCAVRCKMMRFGNTMESPQIICSEWIYRLCVWVDNTRICIRTLRCDDETMYIWRKTERKRQNIKGMYVFCFILLFCLFFLLFFLFSLSVGRLYVLLAKHRTSCVSVMFINYTIFFFTLFSFSMSSVDSHTRLKPDQGKQITVILI